MKKVAIIGTGPTGIYTLLSLIRHHPPCSVTIFEQTAEAGVGMPYRREASSPVMLANIASIEIPPVMTTYIAWLRAQCPERLAGFGITASALHERQFLPRILLGDYFRQQFLQLVDQAESQGFILHVHTSCQVTDILALPEGIKVTAQGRPVAEWVDFAVIATGHVWPAENTRRHTFFPSPWSGLMKASVPACRVGILGTSLSAIDAAMAVVTQHGHFCENGVQGPQFILRDSSRSLQIVLMSRSGVLPEADFYCPIPYQPLQLVTPEAIAALVAGGSAGLLDRAFRLMVQEITLADPLWSRQTGLEHLNADNFCDAWFAARRRQDPFSYARKNLQDTRLNTLTKYTVPWRYVILRLHEAIAGIVPHLSPEDSVRFRSGLARVFIDNYAAIPPQSLRRLLALHDAGILTILPLGQDYRARKYSNKTVIFAGETQHIYDIFIDARGQKPLKTRDLPFPGLRKQMLNSGGEIPQVAGNYLLLEPASARGHIAFGALPYLMHDRPFIQGLTVSAEIGETIANAILHSAPGAAELQPGPEEGHV
ncbi:FAD-NAD(P)-binding protein [Tatumella ptyseos]|nr:FAD-NAD(P)-binding protein [Tatumella ptyseos]